LDVLNFLKCYALFRRTLFYFSVDGKNCFSVVCSLVEYEQRSDLLPGGGRELEEFGQHSADQGFVLNLVNFIVGGSFNFITRSNFLLENICTFRISSVVHPKLFFPDPDPDPTLTLISDPDPDLDLNPDPACL
jgi:hypothetical protein